MDIDDIFSVKPSTFINQDLNDNPSSLSSDRPDPTTPLPLGWPWNLGPFGTGGDIPSQADLDLLPPNVIPQYFATYPLQPPPVPSSTRQDIHVTPKVAIPRAKNTSSLYQRRRSARACEACRQRKVKCDGVKPVCRKCHEHSLSCIYVDVKRVREQKQLKSLAKKVDRYEKLLREIEPDVEPSSSKKIRKTLKNLKPQSEDGTGNSDSSSSAGSLAAIDLVQEDLNRSEKTVATGYFGKNSEIAWMQKLENDADRHSSEYGPRPEGEGPRQDTAITMMSYHLDDLDLKFSDSTDPYALPPKTLADRYFAAYMESVHPSFCVIRKTTFTAQYEQFFNQPSNPPRRWLAILNMIFAIGCRYCRLVGRWKDGDVDDLEYLNRARKLSMNDEMLFNHADLQQIQVEFLIAFHLVCLGQINRAFKFSGMAFHSAISLGINLRFMDDRTKYASKEARSRLWWSIIALEHLLTSITGRVSGVGEGLSATPLPMPFEEEGLRSPGALGPLYDPSVQDSHLKLTLFQEDEENQSDAAWLATCEPSESLFFHCLVDLLVITQAVINNVYSIQALRDPTNQMEQKVQRYSQCMDAWLHKVPTPYRFTVSRDNDQLSMDPNTGYIQERTSLAIYYFSARIILCRPCLNHPSCPLPSGQHRRSHSTLRARMTSRCLHASSSLISVLSDQPDIIWLGKMTPWWAILHFIMQATTVLLIGLSNWPVPDGSSPDPSTPALGISTAVTHTKKAFRWLHYLSHTSKASRRAFILCESFLRRIAPNLGLDISDVPDSSSLSPLGEESGAGHPEDMRSDE